MRVRRAPDPGQQMTVRQHPPGVARQQGQQRVLKRAELHRRPVHAHHPPGHVQVQRAHLERFRHRSRRLARVAQRRPDPGHQLRHAERLFHVVVGAVVQGGDLLRLPVAGRQDHDRHRREPAQRLQRVLPVHVRQPEIEQDQRGRPACGQPDAVGRSVRAFHGKARRLQRRPQEAVDLRLVVDDQDAGLDHAEVTVIRISVPGEPSRAASGRGLTASIVPPIASIMPRAMARPSPVPGATRSP